MIRSPSGTAPAVLTQLPGEVRKTVGPSDRAATIFSRVPPIAPT